MALFGTDGVRGVAGEGIMAPDRIQELGRAVAGTLRGPRATRSILLAGRDTRSSGPSLQAALSEGFLCENWDVVDAGVIPTPAVARLVAGGDYTAGAVVSASHNPARDNGIKFFDATGTKITVETELQIETALTSPRQWGQPQSVHPDTLELLPDSVELYQAQMLEEADLPAGPNDLRVIVDCAHGAASSVWSPTFLEQIGIDGKVICAAPDGANINDRCGATHLDRVAEEVNSTGADLGIAFDGDADRALFIDGNGQIVDGDAVLAILARALTDEDQLPGNMVVATVMSNMGLEKSLAELGVNLIRTPVGDRHVAQVMREQMAILGGEQSGHIILASPCIEGLLVGDGTRTALAVLKRLLQTGRSLADLASDFQSFPQVLINVPVREKHPFEQVPPIHSVEQEISKALVGRGRLLLRYSGTEPIARIMLEGEDAQEILLLAKRLEHIIQETLGTPVRP